MPEEICLCHEIGTGQPEVSVITTFSIYLPFYEAVILPKLMAAGCRVNVVLVDAGECKKALADEATRPTRAGRDYALLPIQAAGSFHPKLVLLVGRKAARLFVGSHNLTLAGYSQNRELTTAFATGSGKSADPPHPVRDALALITGWAGQVGPEGRKWLAEIHRLAPWLSVKAPAPGGRVILGTGIDGPTLWAQLAPLLPQRARRVVALGAFFDRTLRFLNHLQETLAPTELVVGIDPETVEIPSSAAQLAPSARFVNVKGLREGTGYLHAKALYVEAQNGEGWLVTGSPNPSGPAWLSSKDRNIEAVVVQRSKSGSALLRDLALDTIDSQPTIERETWRAVQTRRGRRPKEPVLPGRLVLAYPAPKGFRVATADLPSSPVRHAVAHTPMTDRDLPLSHERDRDALILTLADPVALQRVTVLELRHASRDVTFGIPFDPRILRAHGHSEAQKALERALLNLETSLPDVGNLLQLVEKVVFVDLPDREIVRPGGRRGKKEAQPLQPGSPPESLATDLAEAEALRRRRRYATDENLALLLDTLIHALGQGIVGPRPPDPGEGREDDRPPEDPLEQREATIEETAAFCRRKVKTLLLHRLVPQIDKAYEAEDGALRAVYQAAAVLGLLKQLTHAQQVLPALPPWERLVQPDHYGEVVEGMAWEFCLPEVGLAVRCLEETGLTTVEEISIALGLLMWAAWLAGFDARRTPSVLEEIEDREDALLECACALWVAMAAARDPRAEDYTRTALTETCRPQERQRALEWCAYHYAWGKAVGQLRRPTTRRKTQRAAVSGDLAWLSLEDGPDVPTVVVRAYPGRVELADCTRDEWLRKISAEYAVLIELPQNVVAR